MGVYKYKILIEQNLILMLVKDDLSVASLKELRQAIADDKDFNPSLRLLIDVRGADLQIPVLDIKNFGNWYASHSKLDPSNKKAFLTKSPDQVMKSFVFTTMSKLAGFNTFSTLEACLSSLEIHSQNVDIINKELKLMDKL